jgi:sugar O-acyltransferase (sialic acid O-acetyltransferase NeuD family)
MLIVGAGGLAAQLFEDIMSLKNENIFFWSETETKYSFLKENFKFISTDEAVKEYFNTISKSFILCVGGVESRKNLLQRFSGLGGEPTSFISPRSTISTYATIKNGTVVLSRVEIEANVFIGKNALINKTANIGHGCLIGNNCEVTPGVILTGEVEVGDDTSIGTGTIVLPKVKIGRNVTIAAGSLIKKDIPDNAVVSSDFSTIKFYKKNEVERMYDNI